MINNPTIEQRIAKLVKKGEVAYEKKDFQTALDAYLDAGMHIVQRNWSFSTNTKIRALCQYDYNSSSDLESFYLIGSEEGILYAVNMEGNILWNYQATGWITGVFTADTNNNGDREIVFGADKVYILNSKGDLQNTIDTSGPVTSIKNGVLLSSNQKIIVTGHDSGLVSTWDFDGNPLWSFHSNGKIIRTICDDIDGDGNTEVVVASEDKTVYILDELGVIKDSIPVNHWIVNLDTCNIIDNTPRLFVGVFEGDVHVYKHYKEKDSKTIRVKQHGILGLRVEYLIPGYKEPQFIIGTSDKSISIMDFGGNMIWSFDTGTGQRELIVYHDSVTDHTSIIVGTESGEVLSYTVYLVPNLLDRIKECYHVIGVNNPKLLNLSNDKFTMLDYFIQPDPVNREANIPNIFSRITKGLNIEAIDLYMNLWWNQVELSWIKETDGRIYSLSHISRNGIEHLLASSEDKNIYCINASNGSVQWTFTAHGGIRGVCADNVSIDNEKSNIVAASVDGSVYFLNDLGEPLWNFYFGNWNLFTYVADIDNDSKKEILIGSEDKCIYAMKENGVLLWRVGFGARVRAVYSYDINGDGNKEIIAGSDDKQIYILNKEGEIIRSFTTPHFILVTIAEDIDDDGEVEILTGNEDGFLHVYDQFGHLKWQFKTGLWVAALGTYRDPSSGEIEIVVGSADKCVYGLDKYGVVHWQYRTGARVRTLLPLSFLKNEKENIAFGSYDRCIYFLTKLSDEELELYYNKVLASISQKTKMNLSLLSNSNNESSRAFFYLGCREIIPLVKGMTDDSDVVKVASACTAISHCLESIINNDYKSADLLVSILNKSDDKAKRRILQSIVEIAKKDICNNANNISGLIDIVNKFISLSNSESARLEALRSIIEISKSSDDILKSTMAFSANLSDYAISELSHICSIILSRYGYETLKESSYKEELLRIGSMIRSQNIRLSEQIDNLIG